MTGRHEPYRVSAYNTAKHSENKMHDDAVAQRFGFSGGLVPGVDVMAYMMYPPVAQWGRAFLERGRIEARFVRPVYDGETAFVTAEETANCVTLRVESRDEICATGGASLPAQTPRVELAQFHAVPPVATRRPVDSTCYELGQWLGTAPQIWDGDALRDYLADVRENDPIFSIEGLLHPGVLQRIMNRVLVENAMLGPWIHVGSDMQLLSAARLGERLTARAKVTGNYDKNGHRFVELDALIVADETRPVAHCHHVAIVQPRARVAA